MASPGCFRPSPSCSSSCSSSAKKGYGESYDRKVILGASLFIWGWEIIKTIYIFNSADYAGVGLYTVHMLPFHICSMALYAYPIIAGRHKKAWPSSSSRSPSPSP
ncbi:MAG: hypothetical protein MZW92_12365 [Comamonadaceae bacterium]|nr:hypothetical protein [Comamonadaceae bacterium]